MGGGQWCDVTLSMILAPSSSGLLVLAPAGIADETGVADQDALTAYDKLGVIVGRVGQLKPVRRRHGGFGNDEIGGFAVAGAVVAAADQPDLVAIALEMPFQAPVS